MKSNNNTMRKNLNDITQAIIGAAIDVQRELGPGLLESAYEACLAYKLLQRRLNVERQKELPLRYRDVVLDCGYRIDLLVEDAVIVEVKSVDHLEPIHEAQLLSYLRLAKKHLGLLIKFNVKILKEAIRRLAHELPE